MSTTTSDFDEIVRGELRRLLSDKGTTAEVDSWTSKLFLVTPFYSVESWLFQNTTHAIALCKKHHSGADVDQFQKWAEDRTLLDEVAMPKEQVRLRSAHNAELAANGFPAEDIYAVRKSFAQLVDQLKASALFSAALAATY
jgi:hypothetical protein